MPDCLGILNFPYLPPTLAVGFPVLGGLTRGGVALAGGVAPGLTPDAGALEIGGFLAVADNLVSEPGIILGIDDGFTDDGFTDDVFILIDRIALNLLFLPLRKPGSGSASRPW